ncbi:MAG: AbrB/MazE/SpoVT family DNA-binding domain-containing protein [Eubacteriales bacterium]|nr:AbrB/MazE/SpoVT family DNA-binding domain-containing protein [Eubacteriales bacterium]
MEAQIVKWGNGQGIRIPKLILQELDIQVNDRLRMEVRGNQIIIEKISFRHQSLEERAKEFGGSLGPYTEFDWGKSEGREIM